MSSLQRTVRKLMGLRMFSRHCCWFVGKHRIGVALIYRMVWFLKVALGLVLVTEKQAGSLCQSSCWCQMVALKPTRDWKCRRWQGCGCCRGPWRLSQETKESASTPRYGKKRVSGDWRSQWSWSMDFLFLIQVPYSLKELLSTSINRIY